MNTISDFLFSAHVQEVGNNTGLAKFDCREFHTSPTTTQPNYNTPLQNRSYLSLFIQHIFTVHLNCFLAVNYIFLKRIVKHPNTKQQQQQSTNSNALHHTNIIKCDFMKNHSIHSEKQISSVNTILV
jgi:hypothetical protein